MTIRMIVAIVVLALLSGGLVGFNLFRDQMIDQAFAEMGPQPQAVAVHEVEAGPWQPGLTAFGTVSAARGVMLVLEAEGRILEVTFDGNQDVAEGDLLVRVEDDMQRAELAAAVADAWLAEQALDRAETLGETGTAAEVTVEEAEATLSAAQAQVERLEATLRRTRLVAPFDGEIGIPQVETGQFADAGMEVASLQRTDTVRVDFSIAEREVRNIAPGQTVQLIGELEGDGLEGEISAIEPRTDPDSRLVSVRAPFDNTDGLLRPGQFVRVRVLLDERDDVIAVPQTAVITSLFGDYVYALNEPEDAEHDLEVRQVFVEIGAREGDRIEIADGLEPGDRVVTAGQNRLSNRSPVTIDPDEAEEEQREVEQ